MGIVIFDGVAYGMLLFLVGVGLSVTLGLMRFVNLAHGVFAMAGGYAAVWCMQRWGLGFYAALGAAFAVAALLGALLEGLLYRRLYGAATLDQVLLSIGLVFVAVAAATWLFGPAVQPFALPPSLQGQVRLGWLGGLELGRYRLFLVACGALVLAALLLLGRTRHGAMVRAAVDNPRVAAATGIDVRRLFAVTFALACGLAGLGGALSLGLLGLEPHFPLQYLVYFLLVVCVGGAGSIAGPFLAALLVGIVDVAGKYYLPQAGAFLVYLFMVAVLLLRPHGLLARKGAAA
ncbi:branched-chain amino acid ABC transporter permease [Ramlibacter sp. H39-3-26]|uniref:branched-chain amino acid ABC transporter permease n=1 Tax=Curvibacter soli TaxID=3031331 RepID=UPI0023DA305D|nr:branched-chain amino acid ABC transporter permease [Ramlibacter sp. H39-3-26]MDF1485983.1 branched-chain amino acid ABC transporter permease [Ramlibacter sp. H39-3-26]